MNLSGRRFNRRFTRFTLEFSKTQENLKHSMALFTAGFNWYRVHGALKKQTPAMATVQLDTVSGARLVPSRSPGKGNGSLKSFYEPVSTNGAAASWDNSHSDGRADTVLLCTPMATGLTDHVWTIEELLNQAA
jgi:hypothetical protein